MDWTKELGKKIIENVSLVDNRTNKVLVYQGIKKIYYVHNKTYKNEFIKFESGEIKIYEDNDYNEKTVNIYKYVANDQYLSIIDNKTIIETKF
jgi:hypothetical protein